MHKKTYSVINYTRGPACELAKKVLDEIPEALRVTVHEGPYCVDIHTEEPYDAAANVDFLCVYEGIKLADHLQTFCFNVVEPIICRDMRDMLEHLLISRFSSDMNYVDVLFTYNDTVLTLTIEASYSLEDVMDTINKVIVVAPEHSRTTDLKPTFWRLT